jgi:hypothetical protein
MASRFLLAIKMVVTSYHSHKVRRPAYSTNRMRNGMASILVRRRNTLHASIFKFVDQITKYVQEQALATSLKIHNIEKGQTCSQMGKVVDSLLDAK